MNNNHQRIIVEIDEQRFEISKNDIESPAYTEAEQEKFIIKNDFRTYEINVLSFDLNSGICTIQVDGQIKSARVLRDLDVLIEKMGLNASHDRKQSVISAPMPGLVTHIKIAEGDQVEKGHPLVILEAMKMENVIAAPHDATIKKIGVTLGQAVERGFPLIELV